MGLATMTSSLKSIRMFPDFYRVVKLITRCPLSEIGVSVTPIPSPPSVLIAEGAPGLRLPYGKSLCQRNPWA